MPSIQPFAAALAVAAVTAIATAQSPGWDWVSLAGPGSTSRLGVVRWSDGRLVCAGSRGEAFEVEGDRWLHRPSPNGPGARQLGAYAYDPAHDLVYLFGGTHAGAASRELWCWDGAQWTNRTTATGPSARMEANLVYDTQRQRLVLYGGWSSAGGLFDTWEFDGTSWQAQSPTTVPDTTGTAMSYDVFHQRCVLVTHTGLTLAHGKTWTWNGTDWSLVDQNGPQTGQGGAMAYDPVRGRSVFLGGTTNSAQIWEWDGATWTLAGQMAGLGRWRTSLAYDPIAGGIRIFGGNAPDNYLGFSTLGPQVTDAWLWDGQALHPIHGDLRPPARGDATFVDDFVRGELLVFGGLSGVVQANDTWTFDGDRWHRRTPTTSPSLRANATAAVDLLTGDLLLCGGFGLGNFFDELWSWNGSDWTLLVPTGTRPTARQYASFAFDPTNGTMLMYGGATAPLYQANSTSSETWRWNGTGWAQLAVTGPPRREQGALAFDYLSGTMMLWGGRDGTTLANQKNDCWRFDGSTWQQVVTTTTPPALFYPSLYFDPQVGTLVLAGAQVGMGVEFWSYTGGDWVRLLAASPDTPLGKTVLGSRRLRPTVYTGAELLELTPTPAGIADLAGACGALPPQLALRTRARLGSPEFGFDVRANANDLVLVVVGDTVASIPIASCTVQTGGTLWLTAHLAAADGSAQQRLPLPDAPALSGVAFVAQAIACDLGQPLTNLRTSNAWRFVFGD